MWQIHASTYSQKKTGAETIEWTTEFLVGRAPGLETEPKYLSPDCGVLSYSAEPYWSLHPAPVKH